MRTCVKCIVPSNFPGVHLDKDGICSFCREYESFDHKGHQEKKARFLDDFERTMSDAAGKGREYDCLVSLSGGKDSAYLLDLIVKKYKLRTLAFTVSTGFESKIAEENIHRIVTKLKVDHLTFRPHEDFFIRLYSHLFRNISSRGTVETVCFSCGTILYGFSTKLAVEKDIPIVIHGFGPGQPPHTKHFYEMPEEHLKTDGSVSGTDVHKMLEGEDFTDEDRRIVWRYDDHKGKKLPRVLMPLHVLDYNEDQIMKAVAELGLIKKSKASPLVTNCILNWPMVYFNVRKKGYNPYADFFSEMIRAGQADRGFWLKVDKTVRFLSRAGVLNKKEVNIVLKKLKLTERDIMDREWK